MLKIHPKWTSNVKTKHKTKTKKAGLEVPSCAPLHVFQSSGSWFFPRSPRQGSNLTPPNQNWWEHTKNMRPIYLSISLSIHSPILLIYTHTHIYIYIFFFLVFKCAKLNYSYDDNKMKTSMNLNLII